MPVLVVGDGDLSVASEMLILGFSISSGRFSVVGLDFEDVLQSSVEGEFSGLDMVDEERVGQAGE